jgi:hypothetical protein
MFRSGNHSRFPLVFPDRNACKIGTIVNYLLVIFSCVGIGTLLYTIRMRRPPTSLPVFMRLGAFRAKQIEGLQTRAPFSRVMAISSWRWKDLTPVISLNHQRAALTAVNNPARSSAMMHP